MNMLLIYLFASVMAHYKRKRSNNGGWRQLLASMVFVIFLCQWLYLVVSIVYLLLPLVPWD